MKRQFARFTGNIGVLRERCSFSQEKQKINPRKGEIMGDNKDCKKEEIAQSTKSVGECSIATPNKTGGFVTGPIATTIARVMEQIINGDWKKQVEAVRANEADKKTLPNVLFSGRFEGGTKASNQISLSGYAVVDFDYKGKNQSKDWSKFRKSLSKLPFVAGIFKSARGRGLKVIVRLPNGMKVEDAVPHILRIFAPFGFEIDTSSRAFVGSYVSYDPEALPFRVAEPIPIEDFDDLSFESLTQIFNFTLERFYSRGNGKYFDTLSWSHYTEAQVWRAFKGLGFPRSYKDEVFKLIAQERMVDDVYNTRSGHNAGYYNEDGHRFLVHYSPALITPEEGKFLNIKALLKARFLDSQNPEQYMLLLAWLQRSRLRIKTYVEAFERGELPKDEVHVPALIIMGKQGLGKGAIFKRILLPLLGGRCISGCKPLCEASQFNSSLLTAEVILVDDYESTPKFSRGRFAGKLKETLFSACVGIEGKFESETSSARICPIFIQLLNQERIETTPDYYSIRDKAIFLLAGKYSDLPEDDDGDFEALNDAIERELPAFVHYIDNLELPESIMPEAGNSTEQRVGMKLYAHPQFRELLEGSDKAIVLLNEFDACACDGEIGAFYDRCLSAGRIQELAGNRIKGSPESIGRLLLTLHDRFPERVEQCRSGGQSRGWIIHPPKR